MQDDQYRNEHEKSEHKYVNTGWMGRLRIQSAPFALLVGIACAISFGWVALELLVGAAVIAAITFIITILIGGDKDMSDKARMFGVYPALAFSGAIILTSAILFATGWHYHNPPPVQPTVKQAAIDSCKVKLKSIEDALIQEIENN